MLASGYSPVYPAHVPLNDLRQRCVGTGPFRLKQYTPGHDGRAGAQPRLLRPGPALSRRHPFPVITERGTRLAALQTGPPRRLAAARDDEDDGRHAQAGGAVARGQRDRAERQRQRARSTTSAPPFDNPSVRRAVSLAMDRYAYVQGVRHSGAVVGAALMPPPPGHWGLPERELKLLPGYRGPARDKAEATQLLAARRRRRRQAAAHRADHPQHRRSTSTWPRSWPTSSAWSASRPRSSRSTRAQYFPALARREYQIGANLTAAGIDDPDALLLRELQVRRLPQLHRLLQRGDGPADRSAVAGARSRQATEARVGHPAQARGRRGPADAGLAQRVLRPAGRT